mgnify:CR=1 FL=1
MLAHLIDLRHQVPQHVRRAGGGSEVRQQAEMLGVDADETMKASISVRIARLRKKLVDVGAQGIVIESIRNVGYQLLEHIEII